MLILTRRVGETVVIGNDVDVTVLGVKGNQVRLGVKAPREVTVHREEIFERICPRAAERQRRRSRRRYHGADDGAQTRAAVGQRMTPRHVRRYRFRRGGRVAEGGGLLNRYTVKSCIVGSNPTLSANVVWGSPSLCAETGEPLDISAS